jgi:hypothetical protein
MAKGLSQRKVVLLMNENGALPNWGWTHASASCRMLSSIGQACVSRFHHCFQDGRRFNQGISNIQRVEAEN